MYVNYISEGVERTGFYDGRTILRLSGPPTDTMVTEGFPEVGRGSAVESRPVRFRPAVLRPRKVICLLRSYRAHAEEGGHEAPAEPMFFAKLANSLIGHREAIVIPSDLPGEVHHEGELALVLGSGGRRLSPERAMECVAAYTVANDVTARTLQRADAARGLPWVRSKSRDTFLPLGPGLVPRAAVPDPHELEIRVEVNGEVRQEGRTSRLLWSMGEVLASISRYMTLEPLDVVLTGTPEGVGPIRPGDRVRVEIPGVGDLENPVVGETWTGGSSA